jgi:DNA-binding LytR/AlgR family response regulator
MLLINLETFHLFRTSMEIRNCIIIEDSESSRLILKEHLLNLPFLNVIGEFCTYSEAADFIFHKLSEIDLIFLDLNLSDEDSQQAHGLDLLKVFHTLPPVIIISSHTKYAVASYEIGKTTDYILKPYSFERLLRAINRVLSLQFQSPTEIDILFLKMGRRLQKFELSKIDFVEAYGIYIKVSENGETHVVNENISTFEKRIHHNPNFIRVHKSYIVNIPKIHSIENYHLVVNKVKIPIGGTYKEKLNNVLRLFDSLD